MELLLILVSIVAFIGSVILHEIAHGVVANWFGDDTAKIAGRLSLNPIVHIDPIGSVLVPAILMFSGSGILFGWAKPVPVNSSRLRGGAASYRWVSLAGIATNFFLAIIAALVLKVTTQMLDFPGNNLGVQFFVSLLQINVVLGVFNSFPLPGFDGFNFFTTFRPIAQLLAATPFGNPVFMAQYGLMASLLLLFMVMPFISKVINAVLVFITAIFGLY